MKKTIYILVAIGITFNFVLGQNNELNSESFLKYKESQADEYYLTGIKYYLQSKYDSCNYYCFKAISFFKTNDRYIKKRLKCYNRVAKSYRMLRNNKKALEYFHKIINEGKGKVDESYYSVCSAKYSIANYYYGRSNYLKAKKYLLELDKAYERIKNSTDDDLLLIGRSYNTLGLVYHRLGVFKSALNYFKLALNADLSRKRINKVLLAYRYNNIANLFKTQGDYDNALEYYNSALNIKLNSIANSASTARTLSNIGVTYAAKGNYKAALEYIHKGLKKILKTKYDFAIAWHYSNLAYVQYLMKDYESSINNYKAAITVQEERFNTNKKQIAEEYLHLGDVFLKIKNFKEAFKNYFKSLNLNIKIFGVKHKIVAQVFSSIALAYQKQSKLKKALKYFSNAIESIISKKNQYEIDRVATPVYIEILKKKINLLVEIFEQTNPEQKHLKIKYLEETISICKLIFRIIDKMQRGFQSDGSKLFFAKEAMPLYSKAIEMAIKLSELKKSKYYKYLAFNFAERNKANILLQKLDQSKATKFSGIPESLLKKEDSLKVSLAIINTELKSMVETNTKVKELNEKYFEYKNKLIELREYFETKYPKYHKLKYQVKTISVKKVKQLLDNRTVLLEYFMSDKNCFVFLISNKDFKIIRLNICKEIYNDVDEFLEGIIERKMAKYIHYAKVIYKKIIFPIESEIQNYKNLLIIPDGAIVNIPFEAIITGSHEEVEYKTKGYHNLNYLIKKFNIKYSYSAELLSELTLNASGNKNYKKPKYDLLAFAPEFSEENFKKIETNLRSTTLKPLPSTKEEVLGLKECFNQNYNLLDWCYNKLTGNLTQVYTYNLASERNLKKLNLVNFKYVHFATHALINSNQPELSGLLLWKKDSREDGFLRLNEIYNLKLNAELVTLSACETGKGRWMKGEGLIGLARGFIFAGAKNVLISFWQVDDLSTKRIMKTFYKNLLSGMLKAEALRITKLEMINSKNDYSLPFYWAAFSLVGKNY